MSVLKKITETEEDYYRYQARQEYLRIKKTEEEDRELLAQANAELEGQKAELENQNAELLEKLKQAEALLQNAGIETPE